MSLHDDIFALTPAIRYVARGDGQQVDVRSRPGLDNASADESDRYEELLVATSVAATATLSVTMGPNVGIGCVIQAKRKAF